MEVGEVSALVADLDDLQGDEVCVDQAYDVLRFASNSDILAQKSVGSADNIKQYFANKTNILYAVAAGINSSDYS